MRTIKPQLYTRTKRRSKMYISQYQILCTVSLKSTTRNHQRRSKQSLKKARKASGQTATHPVFFQFAFVGNCNIIVGKIKRKHCHNNNKTAALFLLCSLPPCHKSAGIDRSCCTAVCLSVYIQVSVRFTPLAQKRCI